MGVFQGATGLFTKDQGKLDPVAKAFKEMNKQRTEEPKKEEKKQLEEGELEEGKKDKPIVAPAPAHRNVFAASLSDRAFSHRIVRDKKKYSRKGRKDKNEEIELLGDHLAEAIDVEAIRRLHDRPGTPGERQAAEHALRKRGAWNHYDETRKGEHLAQEKAHEAKSKEPQFKKGDTNKKYRVTMKREHSGKVHYFGPHEVHASDSVDAEEKVRKMAHAHWKKNPEGPKPIWPNHFKSSSTQRI